MTDPKRKQRRPPPRSSQPAAEVADRAPRGRSGTDSYRPDPTRLEIDGQFYSNPVRPTGQEPRRSDYRRSPPPARRESPRRESSLRRQDSSRRRESSPLRRGSGSSSRAGFRGPKRLRSADRDSKEPVKRDSSKKSKQTEDERTTRLVRRGLWTLEMWKENFGERDPPACCSPEFSQASYCDAIQALWDKSWDNRDRPQPTAGNPRQSEPVSSADITTWDARIAFHERRSFLVLLIKSKDTAVHFLVPQWDIRIAKEHFANRLPREIETVEGTEPEIPLESDACLALTGPRDFATPRDILAHLRFLQADLLYYKDETVYPYQANISRLAWINKIDVSLKSDDDSKDWAQSVQQIILKLKAELEQILADFVEQVRTVANCLLRAVQETCKDSGAYDPTSGALVGNRKEDLPALHVLQIDTLKAIKALYLLQIVMCKRMAWQHALTENSLQVFSLNEVVYDCLPTIVGQVPMWEGLEGFPRLSRVIPRSVDPST